MCFETFGRDASKWTIFSEKKRGCSSHNVFIILLYKDVICVIFICAALVNYNTKYDVIIQSISLHV